MLIIGLDYHPSFQQIAFVDTETGDAGERRLEKESEKAEARASVPQPPLLALKVHIERRSVEGESQAIWSPVRVTRIENGNGLRNRGSR